MYFFSGCFLSSLRRKFVILPQRNVEIIFIIYDLFKRIVNFLSEEHRVAPLE